VKLTVVGSSPAWPNPGGAQSGYLIEGPGRLLLDCGPGVLARLRERYADNGWPRIDAIVVTHFHLDHWGDLVPWVWGLMVGPAREENPPELWVPPSGRDELRALGTRLGMPDMFETTFSLREYRESEPFHAAGLEVRALRLPHYTLETYGFRVTNGARSPTPAIPGPASGSPSWPAAATSSSARPRSSGVSSTGSRAVTCRSTRRWTPSAPRAPGA